SAPTAAVLASPPAAQASPSVLGVTQEARTVAAESGSWSGTEPISYTYHWRPCNATGGACVDVVGATAGTYVLAQADVHDTIRVAVTASNAAGSSTTVSPASRPVAALPNRQLWPYVTHSADTWANAAPPPAIAFVDSGIEAGR